MWFVDIDMSYLSVKYAAASVVAIQYIGTTRTILRTKKSNGLVLSVIEIDMTIPLITKNRSTPAAPALKFIKGKRDSA